MYIKNKKIIIKKVSIFLFVFLFISLTSCVKFEKEENTIENIWPPAEITAIQPFGAGGGSDKILKLLCDAIEEKYVVRNNQIVLKSEIENDENAMGNIEIYDENGEIADSDLYIENIDKDWTEFNIKCLNKVGNNGSNGNIELKNADKDGKTIGLVSFELQVNKTLYGRDVSYVDFDLICRVNKEPAVIIVNREWASDNKIKSLKDFVKYCEENENVVSMGCSKLYSVWHIAAAYFMNKTNVKFNIETNNLGTINTIEKCIVGQTNAAIVSSAIAKEYIDEGSVVALGIMDEKRNKFLPNVKTCTEQGFDLFFMNHRGIACAKDTDEDIKQKLIYLFENAVNDEEFVDFMNENYQEISYLDSISYYKFFADTEDDIEDAISLAKQINDKKNKQEKKQNDELRKESIEREQIEIEKSKIKKYYSGSNDIATESNMDDGRE